MKKKILAILLLLAMILTMIPVSAFADEAENAEAALTEQLSESSQESFDEQAVETEFTEIELQVEAAAETEYETEAVAETETESETETDDIELLVPSYNGINAPSAGTFDCIWFGEYPQAEVVATKADMIYAVGETYLDAKDYIVDSTLYKQLVSASWDDNNDTTIGSSRYHRIYRDNATYATTDISGYYNWKDDTVYHYFKYQPIKWRVLSVSSSGTALVMADKCLDDQKYNDSYASVTWETSGMRSWLNSTFLNMAIPSSSQYSSRSPHMNHQTDKSSSIPLCNYIKVLNFHNDNTSSF